MDWLGSQTDAAPSHGRRHLCHSNGSLGNDCELWASQVGRSAVDTLPATRKATRYFSEWN